MRARARTHACVALRSLVASPAAWFYSYSHGSGSPLSSCSSTPSHTSPVRDHHQSAKCSPMSQHPTYQSTKGSRRSKSAARSNVGKQFNVPDRANIYGEYVCVWSAGYACTCSFENACVPSEVSQLLLFILIRDCTKSIIISTGFSVSCADLLSCHQISTQAHCCTHRAVNKDQTRSHVQRRSWPTRLEISQNRLTTVSPGRSILHFNEMCPC